MIHTTNITAKGRIQFANPNNAPAKTNFQVILPLNTQRLTADNAKNKKGNSVLVDRAMNQFTYSAQYIIEER